MILTGEGVVLSFLADDRIAPVREVDQSGAESCDHVGI
jgi:hypothetical protein